MTADGTLTCRIETLAYGGDGLARIDGRVVFVPETLPGETVRIRVTQTKKTFARAEAVEWLDASPDRIEPCCRTRDPVSGTLCRVPGCVYDHLAYPAEVRAKQDQLAGFLRRLPHAPDTRLLPPYAAPAPLHYRNKLVLHTARVGRKTLLGYRMEPSHRVLDLASCPLACDAINAALDALRKSAAFGKLPDNVDVTLRFTPHDGARVWRNDAADPAPEAWLTENSPSGPLRVPRDGFYQVNPVVGDELVRTVAAWFAERPEWPEVLDLYCGVGVFGFACEAAGATRLTGIESGRAAIAAAQANAAARNSRGVFFCYALGNGPLDIGRWIGDPRRTTVVLDPPRDGLAPTLAATLAASGLPRIFYVSCDPATLTRDLATLLRDGRYRMGRIRLFDMFPRTGHFETLVELLAASDG